MLYINYKVQNINYFSLIIFVKYIVANSHTLQKFSTFFFFDSLIDIMWFIEDLFCIVKISCKLKEWFFITNLKLLAQILSSNAI